MALKKYIPIPITLTISTTISLIKINTISFLVLYNGSYPYNSKLSNWFPLEDNPNSLPNLKTPHHPHT